MTDPEALADAPLLAPLGRADLGHRRPWNTPTFWYGVCYYPEHWDAATRREDAARMAAAGVNVVRLGEFSWDFFEPEEGRYDFSFYDAVLEELHRHGISVIMGTPTAAPPVWMSRQYPEILRVDARGVRLEHGSRQHASHLSATFRRFSRAITRAMAAHFAGHPAVIGWQTDNELHCHFSEDHSAAAQQGFRRYLRQAYQHDIAALNHAWGTAFWAQTYASFAEIETPREGLPTYQNPGARLDYIRFLSDAVTRFQHEQVAILRAADARWFITHNGLMGNIDYRGVFTKDLDVLGFDSYPGFTRDHRQRPLDLLLGFDRTRCLSGNFIVPELQAGPGGQPGYLHDTPEAGEMRSFVYAAIARGADSVLHFRWRSCRMGAEEYWCGILDHDNVPRRRYRELSGIGHELQRVGPAVLGTSVRVDVAIASGDLAVQAAERSYGNGLSSDEPTRAAYNFLQQTGYATGLVHPSDELSRVSLYVIPSWELIDPTWVPALERWVAAGGVLVIGPRSGTRTCDNRITAESWPGVLRPLAGATVAEFGRLNHQESRPFALQLGEKTLPANAWYEHLEPDAGTTVVATWRGRHHDGQPAITRRAHGQGHVYYVGAWLDAELVAALLPEALALSGAAPLIADLPADVTVTVREAAGKQVWIAINHGDAPATIVLPSGQELIADQPHDGSLTLERYGVAVVAAAG
jgi:beta-galactosidase